jgi:hypothetical protein
MVLALGAFIAPHAEAVMRSLAPITRFLVKRALPGCGALALMLAPLLAAVFLHEARADGPGKWTPSVDWSGSDDRNYAVHMALLPSDGSPYHSRVVWWHGEDAALFWGGQWGWKPGDDDCVQYPSSHFTSLAMPRSDVNFFCGGHTALPGGGLLVVSGHDSVTQDYGERRTRIFTPGSCGAPSGWSDPGQLGSWRWYPSATALRDSRVMVTAGNTFPYQRVFGGWRNGVVPASPVGDSVYRFVGAGPGRWDAATRPDPDPNFGRPVPRVGHSAVEMDGVPGFFSQVFFGGRDGNGDAQNDTWLLLRDPNHLGADFHFTWGKVNRFPTDPLPPDRRSDQSAVGFPLDTMMVVFGGLDANDAAGTTCGGFTGTTASIALSGVRSPRSATGPWRATGRRGSTTRSRAAAPPSGA